MGQLALTVYVAHLLALWQRLEWLRRDEFVPAWEVVGVFALAAVVSAVTWRSPASRGPLETVFDLPWWVARRARRSHDEIPPQRQVSLSATAPSSS